MNVGTLIQQLQKFDPTIEVEVGARCGGTGPLMMVGLYFRLDEIIKLNRPIKLKDVPLNMQMVYLTAGST